MFFDQIKEVIARGIGDRLATRNAHNLAFDREDGLAVGELDVEAVARQRHHLLLDGQGLGLVGSEFVEDADGLGDGSKVDGSHFEVWMN